MSRRRPLGTLDPWPLLRLAPIALPQLLALLALITFSAAEGGYPLEHWGPAAIVVALLLAVAVVALPLHGQRNRPALVASAAVLALAGWSALSILWADDRGAAAAATTRTALLALTFVLMARWRHRPATAHALLGVVTAGFGILAWVTVVRLQGADDLDPWFLWDRLLEPVGYVNAGAAFWGIAAFLGVGLIAGGGAPSARAVGAATVVPAAALSFLCLSRGGLLAAAIVAVLLLALLPGRARLAGGLLVAALALLPAAPLLWDIGQGDDGPAADVGGLAGWLLVGTILALLLTALWTRFDASLAPADRRRRAAARGGAVAVAAAGTVLAVCAVAGVGPLTLERAGDAVAQIKDGYEVNDAADHRLTGGLGSGRWGFWTVAWDQFTDAPLLGQGADNYRQDYLRSGDNPENPRYPHSLPLRQLGQLGLPGLLLLLAWIAPVLLATRRLAAGGDPAGRALAFAGGGAVGLWLVHGSVDWLLEFGGLSAIIAAIAGLLVAAAPPRDPAPRAAAPATPLLARALVAGALLAALWTAAQWTAERDRDAAIAQARLVPDKAQERVERARRLDPFSESPDLLLGSLAVRRGDLGAAREAYADAHRRNPRAVAPQLWLGVIASAAGDGDEARRRLADAAADSPRDPLIAELRERVQAGATLRPEAVQEVLAERTRQLLRDATSGG